MLYNTALQKKKKGKNIFFFEKCTPLIFYLQHWKILFYILEMSGQNAVIERPMSNTADFISEERIWQDPK